MLDFFQNVHAPELNALLTPSRTCCVQLCFYLSRLFAETSLCLASNVVFQRSEALCFVQSWYSLSLQLPSRSAPLVINEIVPSTVSADVRMRSCFLAFLFNLGLTTRPARVAAPQTAARPSSAIPTGLKTTVMSTATPNLLLTIST